MDQLNRTLLDLHARANADPFYDEISLFVRRPRYNADGTAKDDASFAVIDERINAALSCLVLKAGKGGAAVTFLMPFGNTTKPNLGGPQMEFVYGVTIQEHPILNFGPKGTLKSAEEIALYTAQLFHLCMLNGRNCLYVDGETLTPVDRKDGLVTYELRFKQQGNLREQQRVALPAVAPRGGAVPQTVTLTCGTSEAEIWYTTDGSYPSSANAAATQYSAPIDLAEACTLRVAAEKDGLMQSDVAQEIFS